jgi:pyocin large subunit-like protein
MIKQKELCEKWAMDAGQISRMVKRGMPLTSEADATKWRLANQQKSFRKAPPLSQDESSEKESQDISNEDLAAISTLGRKLRAERMEVAAFRLMVKASKENNPIATRAAIHAYRDAQRVVRQAELDHHDEQAHLRQTLPASEVQEKYQKYLGGIRQLLDAMPSSICARANPSDPECAKQAIEDAVNQIYLAIQKAEGAFA